MTIYCVVFLIKGQPFIAKHALYLVISRLADYCCLFNTLHYAMKARNLTTTIGINGFSRMGRLTLRAGWDRDGISFNQIKEIGTDTAGSVHLPQYDSVHGKWTKECALKANHVVIERHAIPYHTGVLIEDTDWSVCDIVVRATGVHQKKPEVLRTYFDLGVSRVAVAAPTP